VREGVDRERGRRRKKSWEIRKGDLIDGDVHRKRKRYEMKRERERKREIGLCVMSLIHVHLNFQ